MDFQFKSTSLEKNHIGVIFCDSKNRLIGFGKKLDQISKKTISTVIKNDLSFQNRKSKSFDYTAIHEPDNLKLSKLYVFKLGDFSKYTLRDYQILGGHLFSLISFYQEDRVGLYLDGIVSKGISAANVASEIILGSLLASYKFDKYKTVNKKEKKSLKVKIYSANHSRIEKNYSNVVAISEGVTMTRNLVTEPPNVMTPPEIAKNAASLEKYGVEVTILGEKEMTKLGMGSLLSVGRGSEHESKLAIMRWSGHKNKKRNQLHL